MSRAFPTQPSDMPEGEHHAALVFDSVSHFTPGDERSRTHPGHGYPESWDTVTTIKYQPFKTQAELERFIVDQATSRDPKKYVIIKAQVAKIEIETKVKLS